jgi:hypothetical protein
MSKTGSANGSFFGNFIYNQLLRQRPHFLFDLSRAVDFSFVKAALKDFYVAWGRDPWDLMLMFKMVFLQFLYDLSDRDIEEQCTWNLLFKDVGHCEHGPAFGAKQIISYFQVNEIIAVVQADKKGPVLK